MGRIIEEEEEQFPPRLLFDRDYNKRGNMMQQATMGERTGQRKTVAGRGGDGNGGPG